MTKNSLHNYGWLAVVLLLFALGTNIQAADQSKPDRLEGYVQTVNWDTSTITLGVHTASSSVRIPRYVIFSDKTAFTYRNEPGSVELVKDGRRLICLGKFDKDGRLFAERVDVRTTN